MKPSEKLGQDYDKDLMTRVLENLETKILNLDQKILANAKSNKSFVSAGLRAAQASIARRTGGSPGSPGGSSGYQGLPPCEWSKVFQWRRLIVAKIVRHKFDRGAAIAKYEWHVSTTLDFSPTEDTFERYTLGPRFTMVTETVDTYYVRVRAVGYKGTSFGPWSSCGTEVSEDNIVLQAPNKVTNVPPEIAGALTLTTGASGSRFFRKSYVTVSFTAPTTYADGTTALDPETDIISYNIYYVDTTLYPGGSFTFKDFSRTVLPRFVLDSYTTPIVVIDNLVCEHVYAFYVTSFSKAMLESDPQFYIPSSIETTDDVITVTNIPVPVNIGSTDSTNYTGIDYNLLTSKAWHCLGLAVAGIPAGACSVQIKWRKSTLGGIIWTGQEIYQLEDLEVVTVSSVDYYAIRLDSLQIDTSYEYMARYIDYGKNKTNWTAELTFDTADAVVLDMSSEAAISDYTTSVTPIRSGWFKSLSFRLKVQFTVAGSVDNQYARRFEIRVAKRLGASTWIDHSVFHADEVGTTGSDVVTAIIPLNYVPYNTYDPDEDSGYRVNVRAWFQGKYGTARHTGTWRVPNGWHANSVVNFGEITDPDCDTIDANYPEVTQHWWRYVDIKAVQADFDYPENFAYLTVHATYGEVSLTGTGGDGLSAADARAAQRKSKIATILSTNDREIRAFVPMWIYDGDGAKQRTPMNDFSSIEFRTICHVWKASSPLGVVEASSVAKTAGTTETPGETGDPWANSFVNEDSVAVFTGDHIYTPASTITRAALIGATTIYVEDRTVFADRDIVMVAADTKSLSSPKTPTNELVRITGTGNTTWRGDYITVAARGAYSSTATALKMDWKVVKVGQHGATTTSDSYRYIWIDSDEDNPSIKVMEVIANSSTIDSATVLNEIGVAKIYSETNPPPVIQTETPPANGDYEPSFQVTDTQIYMPWNVGPMGNEPGFALNKYGLFIYDAYTASRRTFMPPFKIDFYTGEATFASIRDSDGNIIENVSHEITTLNDSVDALESVIKVTGTGNALLLGTTSDTVGSVVLGNDGAGAVINGAHIDLNSGGNVNIKANGNMNLLADGTFTASGGNMLFHTGGNLKIGRSSSNYVFDFDVDAETLTIGDSSGTQLVFNGDVGTIRSSNFSSGIMGQGFFIGDDRIEANDVVLRGALKSSSFVYDEVAAVGGRQFISPSAPMAQSFTSTSDTKLFVDFDAGWEVGEFLQVKEGTALEILKVTEVGEWYSDFSGSAHSPDVYYNDIEEDCSSLSGYNYGSSYTSVSDNTFKIATTGAIAETAYKDLGEITSDVFSIKTRVYIETQGDALAWNNRTELVVYTSDLAFGVSFSLNDGGLGVRSASGTINTVSGVTLEEDTWMAWEFIVDSSTPSSATCTIYKDSVLVASDISCNYSGSFTDGRVAFNGQLTNTSYFDYVLISQYPYPAVTQDFTTQQFGKSSASFDGSSYIEIPDSDDWYLGDVWTIDFWYKSSGTSSIDRVIAQRASDGSSYWYFVISVDGTTCSMAALNSSMYTHTKVLSSTIKDGSWHHIAIAQTGTGTNNHILIDGILVSTGSSIPIPQLAAELTIGQDGDFGFITGNLDELRISKGVARWSSDFTPPTTRYVEDSYTKLLLHFDDGLYGVERNAAKTIESNESAFTEDCSDKSGYADDSTGTISEDTSDHSGKETFKIVNTVAGTQYCRMYDDLGDSPTTRIVVTAHIYVTSMGDGTASQSRLELEVHMSDLIFNPVWSVNDGGMGAHTGSTIGYASGVTIETGTWTEWTFDVDNSIASPTCDIYKDGVLVASDLDCSRTGSSTSGKVQFYASGDVVAYVDYIKVGNDFVSPHTAQVWEKSTAVVSLGKDTDDGFILLDSQSEGSPYMDIISRTGTTSYDDYETKVRLGNLSAVEDDDFTATIEGYGLYCDNVYLKGNIFLGSGQDITLTPHASSPASIIFTDVFEINCTATGDLQFRPVNSGTSSVHFYDGGGHDLLSFGVKVTDQLNLFHSTASSYSDGISIDTGGVTIRTQESGTDISIESADDIILMVKGELKTGSLGNDTGQTGTFSSGTLTITNGIITGIA